MDFFARSATAIPRTERNLNEAFVSAAKASHASGKDSSLRFKWQARHTV